MKKTEPVRPLWHFLLLAPIPVFGLTANSHSAGRATWWWALLIVAVACIPAYWVALRHWKNTEGG